MVFGDTTTNRLAGSSFSNIYRVKDTALTASNRPIMADVVTVIHQPAGRHLLARLADRRHAVVRPGRRLSASLGQTAKPGSNGLQFTLATGTRTRSLDNSANSQQDLPFVMEGILVAGNPPNVSVTPLNLNSNACSRNVQTQQTLTVANTGGADLTWSISEELSQPVAQPVRHRAPAGPSCVRRIQIKRTAEELRAPGR